MNHTQLERAFIGAIIQNNNAIIEARSILREGDLSFSVQSVFDTIHEMYSQKRPIDIITVSSSLRNGERAWIAESTDIGFGSSALEYASKIANAGKIKRLRNAFNALSKTADTLGPDVALSEMMKVYTSEIGGNRLCPGTQCAVKRFNKHQAENKRRGRIGELTGFPDFDDKMILYCPNHCWVIGAEPGGGKTAMLVEQLSRLGTAKAVVFSTEASEEQLVARYASNKTGINSKVILSGNLKGNALERVEAAKKDLASKNIRIYDDVFELSDIENECRKAQLQEGSVDLVIVDFVQNCTVRGVGDEYGEQTTLARRLQALMKELRSCGVFYSQLPNDFLDNIKTGLKFKGSGAWRQIADLAGLILVNSQDERMRRLDFRKHRHGPLFKQDFVFADNFTRLEECMTI